MGAAILVSLPADTFAQSANPPPPQDWDPGQVRQCLAKCGNKVTTSPQTQTDEQRCCFYGCRLTRLSCEKQQPSCGHVHVHHHL